MAGCHNLRQGPAWFDIKAMVMLRRLLTCLNAHGSSHGDHGAVVGAQMEFGVMHPNSCFLTSLVQLQSQGPVGAPPPATTKRRMPVAFSAAMDFFTSTSTMAASVDAAKSAL